MTASQFSIEVDQVGHGSVRIGDEDVSNDIAGFELVASAGQVTQLILHRRPVRVTVNGEALVQSPAALASMTSMVQSIPPGEIRKEAESDLYNSLETDIYQSARDAIARILSR